MRDHNALVEEFIQQAKTESEFYSNTGVASGIAANTLRSGIALAVIAAVVAFLVGEDTRELIHT